MMKKVFLSGGHGFIGKNFIDNYGNSLTIDAPARGNLELTDEDAVEKYFSQREFDFIINGANVGGKRNNEREALSCLNENLRVFFNLYKHRHKIERFIQLGSGAEYGRPLSKSKMDESYLEKKIPQDEYGFAKLICSQLIKMESSLKAVNLHLFGVFGPYEDYRLRFISNAIVRVLYDLPIIINQDVIFDYLYVDDCVRIIKEFIQKPTEYSNYNLGTGLPIKLSEIAEIIRSVLGCRQDIIIKNTSLGHEYTCNNERLLNFLGNDFLFTPLPVAIKALTGWYEKRMDVLNRDWIICPQ